MLLPSFSAFFSCESCQARSHAGPESKVRHYMYRVHHVPANFTCLGTGSMHGLNRAGYTCRFDHDIKGQGIYAFVTLHDGHEFSDAIRKDLVKTVREQIGAFAAPDVIHWAPGEPSPSVTHSARASYISEYSGVVSSTGICNDFTFSQCSFSALLMRGRCPSVWLNCWSSGRIVNFTEDR